MAKVRRTVRVHEKTVQNAANITLKNRRRNPPRKLNSPVVVSHWSDGVDPMIVNYVRVNQIHHSRIQVVSPGEIIIHNEK